MLAFIFEVCFDRCVNAVYFSLICEIVGAAPVCSAVFILTVCAFSCLGILALFVFMGTSAMGAFDRVSTRAITVFVAEHLTFLASDYCKEDGLDQICQTLQCDRGLISFKDD